MRRTIVTGGAGFIGSHLVERLLREGMDVTVIDNLSTGNLRNIEQFKNNPRFRFVEADVADKDSITPYFEGVDWVFHLAARADIVPSIQMPIDYHHSNVNGTVSVLEAAREARVKRFLYIASSSCYGIPDEYPTPETAPCKPQYPYALTKYIGEQYALHWHQVYGLPVNSLRLFNVYGPRARTSGTYGAVFGVFLAQKLAGEPLTVVGDGKQTRDFTFVTDVVEAMLQTMGSDISGEIFNVGSGNTYSVNYLVSLLGGDHVHIPRRPGEPDKTFADTTKIRNALGWAPTVSFEQGVKIMLEHIEDWREAPLWTTEKIEQATRDWFRYLGDKNQ